MSDTKYGNCYDKGEQTQEGDSPNEGHPRIEGVNKIYLRVSKEEITTLNRIIESYDNVGVVSTINAQEGLVMIQLTPDTEEIVREIIKGLSFVEEIIEEKN